MKHPTRSLMIGLAVLPMSCGPSITVVKNCAGTVVNTVLVDNMPDPTPDKPHPTDPGDRFSCMIALEPPDPDLRGYYHVRDPKSYANGWAWFTACVTSARALGFSIPAEKITGDQNTPDMTPTLEFVIDTAPLLGKGHGHYRDLQAANISIWRRAYLKPT